MSAAYSNSSRALAFLSETSEDAIAALKGLVGGVGSAKYLDTSEDKLSTIATQIDSSRDEDRIAALTRIVAMVSKGRDASSFLPAVLKLTSSSNLDVRKLVYIVLLRYANSNPDLTLLSINSFQRDLSDPSPLIRAMALRVLSSIKVAMVAPIVIMAVTKASRDPNLYVRKIAAVAIPKCYQIDRSQINTLHDVLRTLLSDRSPFVLGAALSAFQRMCQQTGNSFTKTTAKSAMHCQIWMSGDRSQRCKSCLAMQEPTSLDLPARAAPHSMLLLLRPLRLLHQQQIRLRLNQLSKLQPQAQSQKMSRVSKRSCRAMQLTPTPR